jgi:hypothetical protein
MNEFKTEHTNPADPLNSLTARARAGGPGSSACQQRPPAGPTPETVGEQMSADYEAVVGVVSRAPLVAVERRLGAPMVRLSLFVSRQFDAINVTTVLFYGVYAAARCLPVLQCKLRLGYSATLLRRCWPRSPRPTLVRHLRSMTALHQSAG